MTPKPFKGKALYQPKGAALEYAPWACNFYTGCSNDCEYCYCKRGVLSHVWSNQPKLKACFKDEFHALDIFEKELKANLAELQKSGILFSFTTDPMLPETRALTMEAISIAFLHGVLVQILTKSTEWLMSYKRQLRYSAMWRNKRDKIAFGFTLTGFDEKEPFASSNHDRIQAMRELHELGFKTFASIEPIITPAMSRNMIEATLDCCDLYKIGLISGKGKDFYNRDHMQTFLKWLFDTPKDHPKIYLKDSFIQYFNIQRSDLCGNFVDADYNIFKQ